MELGPGSGGQLGEGDARGTRVPPVHSTSSWTGRGTGPAPRHGWRRGGRLKIITTPHHLTSHEMHFFGHGGNTAPGPAHRPGVAPPGAPVPNEQPCCLTPGLFYTVLIHHSWTGGARENRSPIGTARLPATPQSRTPPLSDWGRPACHGPHLGTAAAGRAKPTARSNLPSPCILGWRAGKRGAPLGLPGPVHSTSNFHTIRHSQGLGGPGYLELEATALPQHSPAHITYTSRQTGRRASRPTGRPPADFSGRPDTRAG